MGRITIPKETLTMLDIKEGDAMDIYVDGNMIILKKFNPGCVICGACSSVQVIKGKLVCDDCAEKIARNLLE